MGSAPRRTVASDLSSRRTERRAGDSTDSTASDRAPRNAEIEARSRLSEVRYKTPVSALVLIHTTDLQVLLLERADKAGFWQSVTGSLENDETPYQAAIREVWEETGLAAADYHFYDMQASNVYEIYEHWRYRYAPSVTHNTEHLFGLELPAPLPVQLAVDEHVRYEWVDWREAAKKVFSWTNVDALKRLGERYHLTL
jgi:dATP pyrophosphohydrolase